MMKGGTDMFLSKKSFWKILIIAGIYFVLGSICIALAIFSAMMQLDAKMILYAGIFAYVFGIIMILWGRFAEGKGNIINLGNKLVLNELKPAEFIKRYEEIKNSADLVVNRPSIDVLKLVAIAYDTLDKREESLSVADEIISVAKNKKKAYAKLIKADFLFSYGMTQEAEALFTEAREGKQDFICQAVTNAILQDDRAMVMGDYKTVEIYCLKRLEQTFPKLDNLSRLVLNFRLGEVYEKLQNNEKAISYYRYCFDNGGETAIKESAGTALERLQ